MFRLRVSGQSASIETILDTPTTGLSVSAETGKVYAAHFNGVRVLTPSLKRLPEEHYSLKGAYVHDVKITEEGLLVVVETARDVVNAYAPDGTPVWSWTPSPPSEVGDRNHINSVLVTTSGLLASMFAPNPVETSLGQRLEGAIMSAPAGSGCGGEIVHSGLRHPHSLVESAGALWLCESRRNRVLRFEHASLLAEIIADQIPGYTRGLCITDEWIIVGQSRSDGHFVELLIDEEPTKEDAHCGIWFFPRGEGERFFIDIPAQEVYDIVEFPA